MVIIIAVKTKQEKQKIIRPTPREPGAKITEKIPAAKDINAITFAANERNVLNKLFSSILHMTNTEIRMLNSNAMIIIIFRVISSMIGICKPDFVSRSTLI